MGKSKFMARVLTGLKLYAVMILSGLVYWLGIMALGAVLGTTVTWTAVSGSFAAIAMGLAILLVWLYLLGWMALKLFKWK